MNEISTIVANPVGNVNSTLRLHRFVDLDYVKAVAIIFVVLGHIGDANAPEWAASLKFFIYSFHMPLFMYVSGFAFFLSFCRKSDDRILDYIVERSNRLLIPFIAMFFIIINLKYIFGSIANLHRSDFNYAFGYSYIFFNTEQSPALDLWYLVVLFIYSTITFAILKLRRSFVYPALGVGLLLYVYFAYAAPRGLITQDFYIARMCWFYIFFMVGCVSALHCNIVTKLLRRWWWMATIMFVIVEYASQYLTVSWGEFRYLFTGGLAIIACHGYMQMQKARHVNIFDILARNTMVIYLLNSIIIALGLAVMKRFFDVTREMPLFYAVLFPLGLLLPVAFREGLVRGGTFPKLVRYIS